MDGERVARVEGEAKPSSRRRKRQLKRSPPTQSCPIHTRSCLLPASSVRAAAGSEHDDGGEEGRGARRKKEPPPPQKGPGGVIYTSLRHE